MKRILIFSLAYYPDHVSGAEAAIKEITDRISADDFLFDMVTLRFDPALPRVETIGNVRVHRVGIGSVYVSKILFPILAAIRAYQLYRRFKYDVLWAMMTYMLLPVTLARGMGVRVPYILSLQDGDSYEKVFGRARIRPFLPLINWGFRHVSLVQAISKHLASWPSRRGYRGQVVLVHNGANQHDVADDSSLQDIVALKQELGKKEGDVYLINTARLELQKGNDDIIRALALLPVHIQLLLVGSGSEEPVLRALAKELRVEDRVHFIGHVDRSRVTLYRKAADIFVGPSRSEGLGNAFLSAMASRVPVVATQEGGLAEFVSDAKHNPNVPATAWVVDKNSPTQIAEAVTSILSSPQKVQEVTAAARTMVVESYTWDIIAKKMQEEVFTKVCT